MSTPDAQSPGGRELRLPLPDVPHEGEDAEALRRSEAELADSFENVPVALHWVGPDGTILRANRADRELLGYTPEEYVGRPVTEFHADRRVIEDLLRRLRGGEELRDCAARLRCKDGSVRHVRINANVLWKDGRFVHARCVTRDLTGQQWADEANSFLSEAGDDYTCVARFNGRDLTLESASEGFTRITGYTVGEFNARVGAFGVHPDDLLMVLESFERLTRGEAVSSETRLIARDGAVRWLRYFARPSWEPGDPPGFLIHGAARDVTDRKQASERVQEAEQRFRQLAENIKEVFWMTDPLRSQILYCSPAYEEVWGQSRARLAQQPWVWLDSVAPADRDRFVAALETQSRGEATDLEYRIVRPDGSVRWVRDRSFPVKDPSGQLYRVAGVADDVTERKQAEEAGREADRRKDEFLATLAHELRNPLAPIRNSLHLLRRSGGPGAERVCAMMERQVGHLVRLVDDLLEVSRITRGKIELRKERVGLAAVIHSAVETSQPFIEGGRHRLTLSLPPEPLTLEADPVRLAQVIANLLNNAAKYTEEGGDIWLTAGRDGGEAVVSVRDNGLGIAPDMLPRVFDLFAQADRTLNRARGGLGIGLTLVKGLVQMHGGRVEAHSAGPGRGSEFIVRLPLAPESLPPGEDPSGASGRHATALLPRRLLVVDDNRDAADSLGLLLEYLGADVQVVYDGLSALEAVRTCRPAVVLLDIGMPGLDGLEVARRIRQGPESPEVTLVAMTGWGQEEDRRRSREAGFDHHLVKPVDVAALQTLLASLQSQRAPAGQQAP